MHVPGIMSWPGTIPPRQQIRELAMSMDILPTICKAAGASLPDGYTVDGSDILAVAAAQAKSPHPSIFWAQNGQLATRAGKWKLVLNGVLYDRTERRRQDDRRRCGLPLESGRGSGGDDQSAPQVSRRLSTTYRRV